MLFSNMSFMFLFLPILIMLYYISKDKYRNYILLAFSLLFYTWGEPRFVLIMMISIIINYLFGLWVSYNINKDMRKIILMISIICNLGLLGYFKYTNWLIGNINTLLGWEIQILDITLPLGISFFTFQAMSYVIDIYREPHKVQKNLFNVALYISLFPQLIAGPIVRYDTIVEQIGSRVHSIEKFYNGMNRFIIGLGKKVLIANTIGQISDEIFSFELSEMSVIMAWLGIITYTLQIYFDFSGYSDMAIGLGKMFGFDFLENFNYPYISKSITEFWRRWHMSLGQWFRDYVYIPLGGNRVSQKRLIINLLVVWSLTGLWHGAQWNFVIWGLYYGIIMIIEKMVLPINKSWKKLEWVKYIYTMILVMIGWVFFRSNGLGEAVDILRVLFGLGENTLYDLNTEYYLINNWIILAIGIIGATPAVRNIVIKLKEGKKNILVEGISFVSMIIIFMIVISYSLNSTFNPFIYFRF